MLHQLPYDHFTLGPRDIDHEIVMALETHLKAIWKIGIEFCVVTDLQVQCRDIREWAQ